MAHTLQERYSSLVLAKLRTESVFYALFNKTYEGNPKAGAVKIPVRDGEVAVGSYNTQTGGTLSYGSTTYKALPIDKDYYVNELIDGYEASAVPDNLVADRLDSAGYSMGHTVDLDLYTLLKTKGTALSDTAKLTASTIYAKMVNAIQKAKKLGLSKNEMWFAVSNETYETLLNCDKFTQASPLGDGTILNGEVGRLNGVRVVESQNIDDATDKIEFILGNDVFAHFVDEWGVPVAINDLKDGVHIGASAVQGRRVSGADISRPTTILVKKHA